MNNCNYFWEGLEVRKCSWCYLFVMVGKSGFIVFCIFDLGDLFLEIIFVDGGGLCLYRVNV